MATCEICRREFQRDHPRKTRCPECYEFQQSLKYDFQQEAKGGKRNSGQIRQPSFVEIENARLKRENDALRKQKEIIAPLLEDRQFLLKIISLTHPDLHGGSKKANDVTRQLLEITNYENI